MISFNKYIIPALHKSLRFLNMLEPRQDDKIIASLSKIAVWISFFLTAYVVVSSPENAAGIITALNAFSFGNYMYRRKKQIEVHKKVL